MKTIMLTATFIATVTLVSNAQGLPPIYEHTPSKLLPSNVVASYPKNTFLENLVKGSDGNLYVTNYPDGTILKISSDGQKEVYATVDGKIAGIAKHGEDEFLITGWDKAGKPSIFLIDKSRRATTLAQIEGGMFPNGITALSADKYLVADSYAGCIWLFNQKTNAVTLWAKDQLLERSSAESENPAANGLKIYKNNLYVSNTNKQILVKIPILNNNAGRPMLYLNAVAIDDFTFDADGNIYAATHVYNSIIKILPNKNIVIVAALKEGVAGCTAVIFGKDLLGKTVLYVSTNGGMSFPPATGVEEGKIVKLSLTN